MVSFYGFHIKSIEIQEVKDKRDEYVREARDSETFLSDLKEAEDKSSVITEYFGKGMFTQIDK